MRTNIYKIGDFSTKGIIVYLCFGSVMWKGSQCVSIIARKPALSVGQIKQPLYFPGKVNSWACLDHVGGPQCPMLGKPQISRKADKTTQFSMYSVHTPGSQAELCRNRQYCAILTTKSTWPYSHRPKKSCFCHFPLLLKEAPGQPMRSCMPSNLGGI